MFNRYCGVKVCPQVLRQMFVTHLHQEQAPPEVMKAEACALEHSEEISKRKYNMMDTIDTMKPLMDFNQSTASKILGIPCNKRKPAR